MKGALSLLHYSGAAAAFAPACRGRGAIFMLHSVSPEAPPAFDPNGILRVTPAFLEEAILAVRGAGHDIISLDEAAQRLADPAPSPPFACFTLDDGYRDNLIHAYPVFKRHSVPFAIYIATDYADGTGDLWWIVLENALRKADHITVTIAGKVLSFATDTPARKSAAFRSIYWPLRNLPEPEMRAIVRRIAADAGYDSSSLCLDLILSWDEIRALAQDPLVTIGAHTKGHLALAKLSLEDAREEIRQSVARIERELGKPCRHFAFPYGDASAAGPRDFDLAQALGLMTAVTTRKGNITEPQRHGLCHLPRISLNGDYQKARYVSALLSGVPFRLIDAIKLLLRGRVATAAGSETPAPKPA
ncbi:MAG: polysaccharide deacetylase [Hyphomicrobiales bacterium]|nr:MAG: polysaccharide deacetylase [Hyphomicrobiales bacterium]